MISDSVALWDSEVCFLHIQLMGTNVRLPKIHRTPSEVDFESSRSPAKSESWNKPSRQCWAVPPTRQHCRQSLVWWMHEINLAKHVSHAWVHFWPFLQICWQTTEDLVFQIVPITSMLRQCVSKLLVILRQIQVLLVWIDDHPSKDLQLCNAAPLLCLPARSIPPRIFAHVLPCRRTTRPSLWGFYQLGSFSVVPAEIRDSNMFEDSSTMISLGLHSRWVHPKYTWSRNDVG